jgi:hypothetical protein
MNNLTYAQKAALDIVFLRYPEDMGFDEIAAVLTGTEFKDFDFKSFAFREHFEVYENCNHIYTELLKIQLIIIDTLMEFNDERHKRVMATIR